MSVTYEFKWVRVTDPEFLGGEVGELNQPFAVYASDPYFGVRTILSGLFENDTYDYTWRFRTTGAGGFLIGAVDLRLTRDGGAVTKHLLFYDNDGQPIGNWEIEEVSGVIQWIDLGYHFYPRNEYEYLSSLDTVTVQYEFWNGTTLVTPFTTIGTGFDLRDLYIPLLDVIEPVTNYNDPDNHTMNFKADIYALPASTPWYQTGWTPLDLSILATADGLATILEETTAPISWEPSGKISSLDVVWDGRDVGDPTAELIRGLHFASVYAIGENPGTISGTYSTADAVGLFYAFGCGGDGSKTCSLAGYYSSHNKDRDPESLGYGWSSEASIKIRTVGNEVFLQMASGNSLRWTWDGSSYVPSSASNYPELEQDGSHWLVSFRDQSKYLLKISDGKLDYTLDRNNNVTNYTYNVDGHLSSVVDHNGRSVTYSYSATRPNDGQPESMTVSADGVNFRTTTFGYHTIVSDPNNPDKLSSVTDPELNETRYFYDENGRLSSILDPQGYAISYEYDEWGRVTKEDYGNGNDAQLSKTYTYTELPESYGYGLTKIEIVEASLVDPEYRQTTLVRDSLGRTLEKTELVFDPQIYDQNASPFDRVYRGTSYEYNDPNVTFNPNPYLLTSIIDHTPHNV